MKTLEKGRSDLAETGEGAFQAEETTSEEGTSDKSLGDGHVLVVTGVGGTEEKGRRQAERSRGLRQHRPLKGAVRTWTFAVGEMGNH